MSEVDELWERSGEENARAFGHWMVRVERTIRLHLRPWARVVDAECLVQETLLRMWVRRQDPEAEPLVGENASLRFACGIAWNLARNEARKRTREIPTEPERMPEVVHEPDPVTAPGLARAIRECLEALGDATRRAIESRIELGGRKRDEELAKRLGMKKNTFLQNVVRARRQVAACLSGKGVAMEEWVR